MAVPLGVAAATGHPIGLIVMSAVVLTTPLGAQQDETALAKKTQTPVADLVEG